MRTQARLGRARTHLRALLWQLIALTSVGGIAPAAEQSDDGAPSSLHDTFVSTPIREYAPPVASFSDLSQDTKPTEAIHQVGPITPNGVTDAEARTFANHLKRRRGRSLGTKRTRHGGLLAPNMIGDSWAPRGSTAVVVTTTSGPATFQNFTLVGPFGLNSSGPGTQMFLQPGALTTAILTNPVINQGDAVSGSTISLQQNAEFDVLAGATGTLVSFEATGFVDDLIDPFFPPGTYTPNDLVTQIEATYATATATSTQQRLHIVNPGGGGTVGRMRISDNNSALPQNRLFFDYSFFHNAPLTSNGVDVNRFTPGFESTFLGGMGSVEMLFPMAVTLSSNTFADGGSDLSKAEFGNIQVITKFLLHRTSTHAVAIGLGISAPTADDFYVGLTDGTPLIRIKNEAVHLTPYIAALCTPNRRSFVHAFLQLDVDTGGNSVFANTTGSGLSEIGVWNDQAILYADLGLGHWLYRNDAAGRGLTGVALTAELHSSHAVSDADAVAAGGFLVGNPNANLDLLNGTVGAHLRAGRSLMTTIGYSFPFTSAHRIFDGEIRAFVNRSF